MLNMTAHFLFSKAIGRMRQTFWMFCVPQIAIRTGSLFLACPLEFLPSCRAVVRQKWMTDFSQWSRRAEANDGTSGSPRGTVQMMEEKRMLI